MGEASLLLDTRAFLDWALGAWRRGPHHSPGNYARSAIIEATGRLSHSDKRRAFTIARGEGLEAFGALETAGLTGDVDAAHVERCFPLADRLYGLLTGLLR
jgi:hypothetical protein